MCVVCVDVCSKLVAFGALHDKASATIAAWFFEHIIFEYIKPRYIQSNHGGEFCGPFDSMLQSLAITHVTTVPYYPQSNGQVEVMNRVAESALHRLMSEHPSAFWDELLPEVKLGMRCVVSSAHGFNPFEVVFKQEPILPA